MIKEYKNAFKSKKTRKIDQNNLNETQNLSNKQSDKQIFIEGEKLLKDLGSKSFTSMYSLTPLITDKSNQQNNSSIQSNEDNTVSKDKELKLTPQLFPTTAPASIQNNKKLSNNLKTHVSQHKQEMEKMIAELNSKPEIIKEQINIKDYYSKGGSCTCFICESKKFPGKLFIMKNIENNSTLNKNINSENFKNQIR